MKQLSLIIFSFFILLAAPCAFAAPPHQTEGSNVAAEHCDNEKCAAAINNHVCNTPHSNCQQDAQKKVFEVFGVMNDGKGKASGKEAVD